MAVATYDKDGAIDVKYIKLTSHTGEIYDLTRIFIEFRIFEDMFSDTITASLAIIDTMNLPMYLPIMGNEKIDIEYTIPTAETSLSYTFTNVGISDRMELGEGKISYVLHLATSGLMGNLNTLISKSYKNKKISEIVPDIFGKLSPGKKLEIEETKDIKNIIIPNIRPMKAINWLMKYAVCKENDSPTYMFFERYDAFWFRTLDTMILAEPKAHYKIQKKDQRPPNENLMTKQVTNEAFIIDSVYFDNMGDIVSSTRNGMYGSKAIYHDIERKLYEEVTYNYESEFLDPKKKPWHLKHPDGIFPVGNTKVTSSMSFTDSKISFMPKSIQQFQDGAVVNSYDNLLRDGRINEFNYIKFTIEVPGTIWINTGDVITVLIPAIEDLSSNIEQNADDKYYTGKFLITAMSHHINKTEFRTILEIVSESVGAKLPDKPNYLYWG